MKTYYVRLWLFKANLFARFIVRAESEEQAKRAALAENGGDSRWNVDTVSRMMASGVIVSIHALGGREIVPPFVVADGLSDDTIAALRRDVLTTQHDTIARNTIKVKP